MYITLRINDLRLKSYTSTRCLQIQNLYIVLVYEIHPNSTYFIYEMCFTSENILIFVNLFYEIISRPNGETPIMPVCLILGGKRVRKHLTDEIDKK